MVNKDVYKSAAILLGKVVGLTSARVKGESGRGLTPLFMQILPSRLLGVTILAARLLHSNPAECSTLLRDLKIQETR